MWAQSQNQKAFKKTRHYEQSQQKQQNTESAAKILDVGIIEYKI